MTQLLVVFGTLAKIAPVACLYKQEMTRWGKSHQFNVATISRFAAILSSEHNGDVIEQQ